MQIMVDMSELYTVNTFSKTHLIQLRDILKNLFHNIEGNSFAGQQNV